MDDPSDIIIPLAILALLVSNIIGYIRRYHGVDSLLERVLEAAGDGDTPATLRALDRLLRRKLEEPLTSVAARIVCIACEYGHPETAEDVLRHLGLKRSELTWEEEGKPSIPFLCFLQGEPEDFAATISFLTQGERTRP